MSPQVRLNEYESNLDGQRGFMQSTIMLAEADFAPPLCVRRESISRYDNNARRSHFQCIAKHVITYALGLNLRAFR